MTWCRCCLQAVQSFVRQAMSYVDQTPNQETKVELIRTLQSVTEGKVGLVGAGSPPAIIEQGYAAARSAGVA